MMALEPRSPSVGAGAVVLISFLVPEVLGGGEEEEDEEAPASCGMGDVFEVSAFREMGSPS